MPAKARRHESGAVRRKTAGIDLAETEVVDAHMHTLRRAPLAEVYARQARSFADQVMPGGEGQQDERLRARIEAGFKDSVLGAPRKTGYVNYVARVYGVPRTIEGFDSVVSKHLGSDEAYIWYTGSVLDRERISSVVLQSDERDPVQPPALIPDGRWVWTYPIVPLVRPAWAEEKNASTLGDLLAAIDATLETAIDNGCVGFKSTAAYYRTLSLAPVTQVEADRAFRTVRSSVQLETGGEQLPVYADEKANAALRTCEDFLYRHMFAKAGELDRPVIIHSAAALSPFLRIEYNDPRGLYTLFCDETMQRVGTRFVILHAGYPSHHALATLISQFPNAYVDMSFFAKYPAALEEVYRVFLAIAPSSKIMHGSDANSIPEEIGYCAWNSRTVLAKVLADFKQHYGWTALDIREIADDVLHRTARKLFRVPG